MVNIQYTTCSFRSSHEPPLELMAFDPGHIYDGKTWETQASKEGGNIPIGYLQNLKLLVLVLPRPVWNGKLEHAVSLSHVILFGLQKKIQSIAARGIDWDLLDERLQHVLQIGRD